jgi:hypothetical protein
MVLGHFIKVLELRAEVGKKVGSYPLHLFPEAVADSSYEQNELKVLRAMARSTAYVPQPFSHIVGNSALRTVALSCLPRQRCCSKMVPLLNATSTYRVYCRDTLFHSFFLLLATATDQERAGQGQYLKAENRILRDKLPQRITAPRSSKTESTARQAV